MHALDTLLAHRAWVRALARTLVRDASSADDLVQETWLAALKRPPRRESVRAWLGTVLRRTAAKGQRSAARRAGREERAARPEAARATVDLVAQAELYERVVHAVLALPEPFRTAVLLRYFDGLPPREIARLTDAPVETVRARLRRGVEKLRAHFEETHGSEWRAVILPLAGAALPVKLVAAALVVVVAAAGALAWFATRPNGDTVRTAAAHRTTAVAPAEETPPADARVPPSVPNDAAAPPAASAPALTGTVVDRDGRPIRNLEIVAIVKRAAAWGFVTGWILDKDEKAPRFKTDENGGFVARGLTEPAYQLVSASERWLLEHEALFEPDAQGARIVAVPACSLVGTVRDAVTGAAINEFQTTVNVGLPRPRTLAGTNLRGRLFLVWKPHGEEAEGFQLRCRFRADGYEPFLTTVEYGPNQTTRKLDVRLTPEPPARGSAILEVVDSLGRPVDLALRVTVRETVFELKRIGPGRYRFDAPVGRVPVRLSPMHAVGEPLAWSGEIELTMEREAFARCALPAFGLLRIHRPQKAHTATLDADADGHSFATQVEGGVTVFAFAPGDWSVKVGEDGRNVTVREGEERTLSYVQ